MQKYTINITIDYDYCIGCKRCIENCPNDVLEFRKEKVIVKNIKYCNICKNYEHTFDEGVYEKYLGDFNCIIECPTNSISISLKYEYYFWEQIFGFLIGNLQYSDKLIISKDFERKNIDFPIEINSNKNVYFEDDLENDFIKISDDFEDFIKHLEILDRTLVLRIDNRELDKKNVEVFANKLYNVYMSLYKKNSYKKEELNSFHHYLNFIFYVLDFYPIDREGNTLSEELHNKWVVSLYKKHVYDLTSTVQTEIMHFVTMSEETRKDFYKERREKNFFKKLYEIKSRTKKDLKEEEKIERNYLELIKKGESEIVEFKSTFKWDINEKRINKQLPKKVCESICAFLNSRGGVLFIGVQDDTELYGLSDDIKHIFKNIDNFLQAISKSIRESLGGAGIDIAIFIKDLEGKKICIIEVDPSKEPVFFENKDFLVRRGTSNHNLNPKDFLEYYQSRFFKK